MAYQVLVVDDEPVLVDLIIEDIERSSLSNEVNVSRAENGQVALSLCDSQRYDLKCKIWKLAPRNPLYKATMAHNKLFNPTIHPDTQVLGFEPDWSASRADPEIG